MVKFTFVDDTGYFQFPDPMMYEEAFYWCVQQFGPYPSESWTCATNLMTHGGVIVIHGEAEAVEFRLRWC